MILDHSLFKMCSSKRRFCNWMGKHDDKHVKWNGEQTKRMIIPTRKTNIQLKINEEKTIFVRHRINNPLQISIDDDGRYDSRPIDWLPDQLLFIWEIGEMKNRCIELSHNWSEWHEYKGDNYFSRKFSDRIFLALLWWSELIRSLDPYQSNRDRRRNGYARVDAAGRWF